ncbi:MAG: hypothetical protein AAGD35_15885 [Actinomycetota bacterium]
MKHGIDDSDMYGVAAMFLAQSLGHKFRCEADVDAFVADLIAIDTPSLPSESIIDVLAPVDDLLDRIESSPGPLEFLEALLQLGANSPPTSPVAERLYRAVLWTLMRHDPEATTPVVLSIVRDATPGGRVRADGWPPHEFFAATLLLVYLGGADARGELNDLLAAARDLDVPDLAYVLDWYLDHRHSVPSR